MNFKGTEEDLSMLLVSAVRYALGRMTYIVRWTCNIVDDNIKSLSDNQLEVMIEDIEKCDSYGMDMDEAEWMNLLRKLKEEQQNRR